MAIYLSKMEATMVGSTYIAIITLGNSSEHSLNIANCCLCLVGCLPKWLEIFTVICHLARVLI